MKLGDPIRRVAPLRGRIRVEPLDDERLTAIERRIVANAADAAARRAVTSASRLPFVLAGAMAALVAVAGFAGWRLRGADTGGEVVAAAEAPPLAVRSEGDHSTIDLGDARIASRPGTAFVVTRPAGGVLVALERGKVALEVGKRGERPPLIVRAGDTDVVVIGTRFSVELASTGEVEVRVVEGVVEVVRHRRHTRVAAGEAWRTERGKLALAELEANVAASELDVELGDAPDVALHDRVAKVPEAPAPPARAGDPHRKVPPAARSRRRTLDNPTDPYVDLKTQIRRQPVLPPAELATTDPRQAIAEYWKSAVKTGAEASRALYSIAHVQYLKLNRRDDALRTLEQYRKRFVGGTEYQAALWLRVRILCLAKLDDDCRKAAYTYVHEARDPASRRLAERVTTTRIE